MFKDHNSFKYYKLFSPDLNKWSPNNNRKKGSKNNNKHLKNNNLSTKPVRT